MNPNYFAKQMTGTWIAQSTYYSLLNVNTPCYNFLNSTEWIYIQDNPEYLDLMSRQNGINLLKKKIHLYCVRLNNQRKKNGKYYIALIIDQFNKAHFLKFDISFRLINQFFIKEIAENYLCLSASVNKSEILQKIYFLNRNVKLIKVIIKKQNYYIGTSFTSEIRIS